MTKNKTFTLISGELYEVTATDKKSAQQELWDFFRYGSRANVGVVETVTDFHGSQSCEVCPENAKGWHIEDEAGITFGGLKQAQNEAIVKGVQYAIDYLEDINYHTGANALEGFLNVLTKADFTDISEWQRPFLELHALYSEECEKISAPDSAARESNTFENGVKWAIEALKGEEFTEHSAILASLYNTKVGN